MIESNSSPKLDCWRVLNSTRKKKWPQYDVQWENSRILKCMCIITPCLKNIKDWKISRLGGK